MKIKAKKLYEFIKKVTINGMIPEFVFKLDVDGAKCMLIDPTNITLAQGSLKNSAFSEYGVTETVALPIKDTVRLMNEIALFDDEITLTITKDTLVMSDTQKVVTVKLGEEEYIETKLEKLPEFVEKFDGGFEINSDILKNTVKYSTVLKETKVQLSVKDKELHMNVGNKSFDVITEKVNVDYHDALSNYGDCFFKIVTNLDGKVMVSMQDNFPIQFKEVTDEYSIRLFLAPLEVNN